MFSESYSCSKSNRKKMKFDLFQEFFIHSPKITLK